MASVQRENDELHETLARKTLLNESLRTDLSTLQSKFDVLSIQKTDLQTRLDLTHQDLLSLRAQIATAPTTDPLHMQAELTRLTKALDSKTRDFDYTSAQYQDASVKAAESGREVVGLRNEVEVLRRRVEGGDIRGRAWEREKRVLGEKCRVLEGKCRLLEEVEKRRERTDGLGGIM
jgi:chromosome segregation ATPase